MQDFSCTKCGSVDVYIDDRGSQKALMCKDCGAWLKWIGKKEMPLIIQYIREHQKINKGSHIVNAHPVTYKLKTERIKDLGDVKRVLDFLNIQVTVDEGTVKSGYEKVKDLFE